ncbi:hypothetical protein [Thalassobacillus pellis]|uniref:hypothetical protein n=1 Tax=Thalassobacillus pellis TaxID=748008 RepID=UPI001961F6C6|nr:hypothetical protein [Thalassobacillus pellis]MBM7552936.1 hypothetical protein [Thalassobacillus pellis]
MNEWIKSVEASADGRKKSAEAGKEFLDDVNINAGDNSVQSIYFYYINGWPSNNSAPG